MQPLRWRQPDAWTRHLNAVEITPTDEPLTRAPVTNGAGQPWHWGSEELVLMPQRALWRPKSRQLMVADLHLGKAEVFQAHGIPIPSDGDRCNLNRLKQLCQVLQPEELLILGDLIHGRQGLTDKLMESLQLLPRECSCKLTLIGGNHDRDAPCPGVPRQPSQRVGQLWLSHEPESPPEPGQTPLLNVCGHVHPVASLRSGNDRLRLPCFAYDPVRERLLIPAFGELTGGHDCGQRYRKWLVAENAIVPWLDPSPHHQTRRLAP